MAVIEALLVELEKVLIEAEIEVANFGLFVAGFANRIKRGAVFWIKAAIELQTKAVVMHWLKRLECYDRIFAAADRNKVATEIITNVIETAWWNVALAAFWRVNTANLHKVAKAEVEIVSIHEFAEAVVEELTEEDLLIVVDIAGFDHELWCAS